MKRAICEVVLALMTTLTSGCAPRVLSSFGSWCGVNFDPDHPCRRRSSAHDGVDFGPASLGDPVLASADGVVKAVVFYRDAGTEVIITHRDDYGFRYRTGYLHLERATVKPGRFVHRGDVIGAVGLFKNSAEIVHVHWRLYGSHGLIDPLSMSAGCFDGAALYPTQVLRLTYPLPC